MIDIGGRTIPLTFSMSEFAEMEEQIGTLSLIDELLLKGKQRIRNVVAALRILGNAGLKAAGGTPDLTDEWLFAHTSPRRLAEYQTAIFGAINEGMAMETKEGEERDLVLEEIERKKEAGN